MSAGAEAGASRKKSASGYNEEQKWFHMETSFLCMEYFLAVFTYRNTLLCAILISASSFSEFNKICRSNESGLDELLSLYVKNHALGAWLCFLCKNIISSIMLFLQVRFAAALF